MNPFDLKPNKIEKSFHNWQTLYPKPYNKDDVDPYTKTRIILMNGTEFEAVWYSHQFSRHCCNNDIRRDLANIRRIEQQQQKRLNALKPKNENTLEHALSYEQLAVDLTAILAKRETNKIVKQQLDFALLEDFDHLYRYADLLEFEKGQIAERLIGKYTEIMPGRPTISEHRHPNDDVNNHINNYLSDPITKLNVGIIVAAEQQTMNYYMNSANFYSTDLGRKLFNEIAMIEEQHVTGYGCLIDPSATWLEGLLMHEYTECYLYYSCYEDEVDTEIKNIFLEMFEEEVVHLHKAAELLQKYDGKHYLQVIPEPKFPELIKFKENINYVRDILKSVRLSKDKENFVEIDSLPVTHDFFNYQKRINKNENKVTSHIVIDKHIQKFDKDYRYMVKSHPVKMLDNRMQDNVKLARVKGE
jgi:rubrerythrin